MTDSLAQTIASYRNGHNPDAEAVNGNGSPGSHATAEKPAPAGAGFRAASTLTPRGADPSRVQPFRWAWQHRVLIGYLNLLVGDEGVGKGTFLAWLTARLTRGDLPGDFRGRPTRVLIVGDEDGFDNIWTPRLIAANADLANVLDLPAGEHGDIVLSRDDHELRDIIREHRIDVVIFDQLLDNLGVGIDDWRGKQVRHAIAPGRRMAAELDIVLIGALHTNKNRSGSFRDRLSGTQQFNALSRSSLLLAEHPEDPERRVLVRGKGNYAKTPPAIDFLIESRTVDVNGYRINVGGVAGLAESDLTIDEVLGQPAKPLTKADQGRRLIADELADGEWHETPGILAMLTDVGISDREARRLAADLGAEHKRSDGFPSHGLWRLPRAGARGGLPDYLTSRTSRTGADSPASAASAATEPAPTNLAELPLEAHAERLLADHRDLAGDER